MQTTTKKQQAEALKKQFAYLGLQNDLEKIENYIETFIPSWSDKKKHVRQYAVDDCCRDTSGLVGAAVFKEKYDRLLLLEEITKEYEEADFDFTKIKKLFRVVKPFFEAHLMEWWAKNDQNWKEGVREKWMAELSGFYKGMKNLNHE